MSLLSSSFVSSKSPSGYSLKALDQHTGSITPSNLSLSCKNAKKLSKSKRALTIHAGYSDGGRPNSGFFVGGFMLGGIVVGTLSCIYAPQISKALSGIDKKDVTKNLPKFIYDEEKALEKQRKKLTEKIEQLNSAMDKVSSDLRSEENTDGAEMINSDEAEALA